MADSMEPCKMLWADPCCHGNEIWARRGDPIGLSVCLYVCQHDKLNVRDIITDINLCSKRI